MSIGRRAFLAWIRACAVTLLATPLTAARRASAQLPAGEQSWKLRRVSPGDEVQLVELMRSCVDDEDSFHGLCRAMEWTTAWAQAAVNDRPQSIVITLDDVVVAYMDIPGESPQTFGEENIDHYQRSFWCGAAGVRKDLLGAEQASEIFQRLLYHAFTDAIALGYDNVRAAAPWPQHPYLPLPFERYPGLNVEPFEDEEGGRKYLLEWNLDEATKVLANEVAGTDKLGS